MNDLLDLLDAWQSSKPRPLATPSLSGGTSQSTASSGGPTVGGEGGQLQVTRSQYFPTPTQLPPDSSNADPEADGGAVEILSVTQTRGAPVGYTPVSTRTYPVRGSIV